jgi:hypothetical protein
VPRGEGQVYEGEEAEENLRRAQEEAEEEAEGEEEEAEGARAGRYRHDAPVGRHDARRL